MTMVELNLDGLIGPTHNYAGLSLGNIASASNAGDVSRPRQAALEGLGKMRLMLSLGLPQGLLLPHERPYLPGLRALGFAGSPEAMCAAAHAADPALFANMMSASAMWTANAATVSPSADTADGRVHLSVANLSAMLHRSIEHRFTHRQLALAFADARHFAVHEALPGGGHFGDEGAANHGRLANDHGAPGLELFVYGAGGSGRFPSRQALRASQAIARRHGLAPDRTLFIEQAQAAIQAGAFHNDVVSVANGPVLFTHAEAFEHPEAAYAAIRAGLPQAQIIEVPTRAVSLADAIKSYLFNSQLLTMADGSMTLVVPQECAENTATAAYLAALPGMATSIRAVRFINVRESMRNGGGPACLRLRVALSASEHAAMDRRFLLDEKRIAALEAVVARYWPETISPAELSDPRLHAQSFAALDALTQCLELGSLYDFQR